MVGVSSIPHWLEILLSEKFFVPCGIHESVKKNEKNIFCLDCCISICPLCLPPHRTHNYLQIRRYVYHDVIRLEDAQALMNCSLVQPYTTNSAKVVFLNQRPMSRPFRGSGNFCIQCNRSLQDPFLFCSLSCKVHHTVNYAQSGSKKLDLDKTEFLPLFHKTRTDGSTKLGRDGQMTPDSVLDSLTAWSESTSGGNTPSALTVSCRSPSPPACTATTETIKKNRSAMPCRVRWPVAAASQKVGSVSRRKGVPHRAPLN